MSLKGSDRKKTLLWCAASSGCALIVLLVLFIINDIMPFGDVSLLRSDSIYQYVPLLEELTQRVKGGESLLYSFNSGLGANFFATICYYLVNPFNLVAFFFPSDKMTWAFSLIIVLNTLGIAFTSAWYAQDRFKRHDLSVPVFSLLYTFSGFYIMAFYNTMWLMPLMLLPLIARGVEKIVEGGKGTLYFASLLVCILCNFYLSYMICIFAVLYFFVCVFSQRVQKKGEESKSLTPVLMKFGVLSLCAGGASAITLMPVMSALSSAYMKSVYGFNGNFFFDFFELLKAHIVSLPQSGSTADEALPMIGLGAAALILAPLYLFNKKLPKNERIAHAALVVILWASLAIPTLYNLWHGMSSPAGLPYRFSFIYCFVIIVMAYKAFTNIKEMPKAAFVAPLALSSFTLIYAFVSLKDDVEYFSATKTGLIISTIVTVCVFASVLLLRLSSKRRIQIMSGVLILVLTMAELPMAMKNTVTGVENDTFAHHYSAVEQITAELDEENAINRMDFAASSKVVVDSNVSRNSNVMSGSIYGYKGVNGFSSLADYDFSLMQTSMGNIGNMGNAFSYSMQTPVYNTLFGVEYVIDNVGNLGEDTQYTLATTAEGLNVYSANGYRGFGVLANPEVKDWEEYNMNSLYAQSTFWEAITGAEGVLEYIEPTDAVFSECKFISQAEIKEFYPEGGMFTVEEHDHDHEDGEEEVEAHEESEENPITLFDVLDAINGIYAYKVDEGASNTFSIEFTITPEKSQNIYLLSQSGGLSGYSVEKNGITTEYFYSDKHVTDLGYCEAGVPVKVRFYSIFEDSFENTINEDEILDDTLFFVPMGFDEEVYQEGLTALDDNGSFEITSFKDSQIEGNISARQDGVMFLPMPYDEGWTVLVDGVETELFENSTHILMFDVMAGEHTVEMKYSPQGLKEGIFVSAASVLVLLLYLLLKKVLEAKNEIEAEEATNGEAVNAQDSTAEGTENITDKKEE